MVLLIDNYDSFSYNLVQLVGGICKEKNDPKYKVKVIRNDELSVGEIRELEPAAIILSPGPGRPENAGVCEAVVKELAGQMPILGVCLGHQGICEAFGAKITYAKSLMHGKQSMAELDTDSTMFRGMDAAVPVARYHSLAADPDTLPDDLKVTARTEDGEIMAVEHKKLPVYGLQFHPESVLTPQGKKMMENFLDNLE